MAEVVITRSGNVVVDEPGPRRDVASVQKSIVSVLVGIAIADGVLQLEDTITAHLGPGWTGRDDVQTEGDITLAHVMSMTSGLGDAMEYVAKPGERWDYSLIAYPTAKRVLAAAAGRPLADITAEWLTAPLSMTESAWEPRVWNEALPAALRPAFVYPDGAPMEAFVSTASDLSRFGAAVMDGCVGLGLDEAFRDRMTRSSQALNPAYGLLWWVNDAPLSYGPKATVARQGGFLPGAPPDAYAALGAGEQCCVVIPSKQLVVVRTADALSASSFAGGSAVDDLVRGAVARFG